MLEMIPLQLDRYSVLGDDWAVSDNSFTAPMVEGRKEQLLIFGDRIRNGSLGADITVLDSYGVENEDPPHEGALVVRYAAPDSYFFAGTGGFATKFFIGRVSPGRWVARASAGQRRSLVKNRKYRLRVEFSGSQITLYENDVQQLVTIDETYQFGQFGFRAWQSRVLFDNVVALKARPKAFLIMPFKSEFDFVHRVIQRSAARFGIDCVRADEIAISRPVMNDVKTQIAEADLVIVDFSGKNPNVYYEAGLADAMGKDWIFLAQSMEDLTFDVRHIRSILYSNVMGADQKLTADFDNALTALGYRPDLPPATEPTGTGFPLMPISAKTAGETH